MPALSGFQNAKLEQFAQYLRSLLQSKRARFGSYVFEKDDEDPLMVESPSLDRALRNVAVKWKLPLPSLGTHWDLSCRQPLDITTSKEATIVVNVDLLSNEGFAELQGEVRKRSRSRNRDKSRRKSRRHSGSLQHGKVSKTGDENKKDESTRDEGHASGRSHANGLSCQVPMHVSCYDRTCLGSIWRPRWFTQARCDRDVT